MVVEEVDDLRQRRVARDVLRDALRGVRVRSLREKSQGKKLEEEVEGRTGTG